MRLLLTAFFLLTGTAFAAHPHPEKHYQKLFCDRVDGVAEFVLDDRARVDCLTEDYALEVDFAPKWAEAIGQSLYYGAKTNRPPAVLLILEDRQDRVYVDRFNFTNSFHRLGIILYTVEDFGESYDSKDE